jgi:hypothetical protein
MLIRHESRTCAKLVAKKAMRILHVTKTEQNKLSRILTLAPSK